MRLQDSHEITHAHHTPKRLIPTTPDCLLAANCLDKELLCIMSDLRSYHAGRLVLVSSASKNSHSPDVPKMSNSMSYTSKRAWEPSKEIETTDSGWVLPNT